VGVVVYDDVDQLLMTIQYNMAIQIENNMSSCLTFQKVLMTLIKRKSKAKIDVVSPLWSNLQKP
jgi:hypothetical protein